MTMVGRKLKVGILTGGGDCPGLNAVIRATVKAGVLRYQWSMVGIYEGFDGLVRDDPSLAAPLGLKDVQGILPRGGTILGTTSRGNPFRYPVKVDGKIEYKDVSHQVADKIARLELDGLIIIGGDGTLKIANALYEQGISVVCVPKTIDNDVPDTDVSFGFDSAVHCAMDAVDRLHSTAASHNRAMILEVMGRHAGWIALETGIAGGADLIIIPEIPYDITKVAEKVELRRKRGSRFVTVVVAEGAFPEGGESSTIPGAGPGQLPRMGGAGDRFARALATVSDIESRVTVLGHIQRGGSPSPLDRILGTRFGVAAVEMVAKGDWGKMVSLRGTELHSVPLSDIRGQKLVDPGMEMVRSAKAIGIGFGD